MDIAYQHLFMYTLSRKKELSVHALGRLESSLGMYHGDCSYKWSAYVGHVYGSRRNVGVCAPIEVMDLCVVHAGELIVGVRIWHGVRELATAAYFCRLAEV